VRRPSVPDPEGRDALVEAHVAADLVRDHREQAARYSAQRARAVMRANQHGASYRVIAAAMDVSIGMVQQWMTAAHALLASEGPRTGSGGETRETT